MGETSGLFGAAMAYINKGGIIVEDFVFVTKQPTLGVLIVKNKGRG